MAASSTDAGSAAPVLAGKVVDQVFQLNREFRLDRKPEHVGGHRGIDRREFLPLGEHPLGGDAGDGGAGGVPAVLEKCLQGGASGPGSWSEMPSG